jgi:hypothetical protein
MYVEKAAKMTFVQKTRAYNVDEIDGRTQKIIILPALVVGLIIKNKQ